MTTKTILTAIALTLAPTVTLAMGCEHGGHGKQAASCATGSSWDADAGKCVADQSA